MFAGDDLTVGKFLNVYDGTIVHTENRPQETAFKSYFDDEISTRIFTDFTQALINIMKSDYITVNEINRLVNTVPMTYRDELIVYLEEQMKNKKYDRKFISLMNLIYLYLTGDIDFDEKLKEYNKTDRLFYNPFLK